jgi:hypothetical protein
MTKHIAMPDNGPHPHSSARKLDLQLDALSRRQLDRHDRRHAVFADLLTPPWNQRMFCTNRDLDFELNSSMTAPLLLLLFFHHHYQRHFPPACRRLCRFLPDTAVVAADATAAPPPLRAPPVSVPRSSLPPPVPPPPLEVLPEIQTTRKTWSLFRSR